MTDALFDGDDANTPLGPDERDALKLTYITTRFELNAAEQDNIAEADAWVFGSRRGDILDRAVLTGLHRRMFDKVWRWAGEFRETDRNIGVPHREIEVALHQLLDDVRYWIANATYSPDEIAIRFHHRLVWIHPFPNGNGRHSRLAADALIGDLGHPRFTWGGESLAAVTPARRAYVSALKAADNHDIQPLLAFSRA